MKREGNRILLMPEFLITMLTLSEKKQD